MFSVYDTLFNVTFVVAVVAGAYLLPSSGVSYAVLAGVALTYLAAAVWYGVARVQKASPSDSDGGADLPSAGLGR